MTLGLLVGRLGGFLEERAATVSGPAEAAESFPADTARLREALNHHIIPLLLLSRADGESVAPERDAILRYCINAMKDAGGSVSDEEAQALGAYIESYRPTRMQLASALKRLETESRERILALVAAAQVVISADAEHRDSEKRFLSDIAKELAAL